MVLSPEDYEIAALLLILAGLVIAVLSLLERRVRWVQRFCAFFGEGCRRTANFTLLGVSISWWGIAFYAGLGVVFFFVRPLLFWAVMAGFGIEITFVATMIAIRALCVFCALNSIVVVLLAVLTFDLRRAGPGLLLAVAAFAVSLGLLFRENRIHFRRPPKEEVLSEIEEEAEKGENPALGPRDAPVEVVEFSDYLCPVCRKARPMVTRIRKEFEGRIRWVYMDFPLEMHEGSKEVARAPRCAGDQGQFWPYRDLLLGAAGKPGPDELEGMATKLGLDPGRFRACLAGVRHRDEIERDIAEGVAAGVSATPTFLVNGRAFVAPSYEELRDAIGKALEGGRRDRA
jgi:thiol-disulfide isomerase/thioredoxin